MFNVYDIWFLLMHIVFYDRDVHLMFIDDICFDYWYLFD